MALSSIICDSFLDKGSGKDFFHTTEEKFIALNKTKNRKSVSSFMKTKYDNMDGIREFILRKI